MIPGIFKKPHNELLNINKCTMVLPVAVVDIIKEYLYYVQNSLSFLKIISKKKKELNLIKSAWSRNNIIPTLPNIYVNLSRPDSSEWFYGFTGINGIQKLKIFGENCNKCGEYVLISYNKYSNRISHGIELCNC